MLADTSAWVEYLRATDSITDLSLGDRLRRQSRLVTCDPVAMEVLAGGRSGRQVADLRGLLARCVYVPALSSDWDDAARIYRDGRRQGVAVRSLIDCVIAAIALRVGEPVLHNDADFDAIAVITGLEVARS